MEVSGFVLDPSLYALPGASVQLTVKSGNAYVPTGLGTTSDMYGHYYLNSSQVTPDKWVTISYIGYVPANIPVDYIIRQNANGEDAATALTQSEPQTMDPVIVKAITKNSYSWLLWILGGFVIYKGLKKRRGK